MKDKFAVKVAVGAVAALAVFGAGYGTRSVQVDHQPNTETLAVPSTCTNRAGQDKLTCIYDWHSLAQAADEAIDAQ